MEDEEEGGAPPQSETKLPLVLESHNSAPVQSEFSSKISKNLGNLTKPKQFGGMSPIISLRTLNTMVEKSRNGTPMNDTPNLAHGGAKTSRDDDEQIFTFEEMQKTQDSKIAFKSTLKELEILERLKVIA